MRTPHTCSIRDNVAALARAFSFDTPRFVDLNPFRASIDDKSEAGVLVVLLLDGEWTSEPLAVVAMESGVRSVATSTTGAGSSAVSVIILEVGFSINTATKPEFYVGWMHCC
jgi:hypothetical protein